jgi:hypothetical protein
MSDTQIAGERKADMEQSGLMATGAKPMRGNRGANALRCNGAS